MTSSHTPGPWRAETYKYGPCFGEYNKVAVMASHYSKPGILSGQDAVADCHGAGSPEQQLANARLIAAAPDLLAALSDLLEQVGACRCRMDFVTDDARAAIAKVEGV